MRCKACNQILNDRELSRRESPLNSEVQEFIDLCSKCLAFSSEASYYVDIECDVTETTGESPWLTQQ